MQQRGAIGRLGIRVGACGQQHLDRFVRLAVGRLAERRGAQPVEAGTGGERRAAASGHRHHHRRAAQVGIAAARGRRGGIGLGLFLHLGRAPLDLRALGDHQLQRFDIGRLRRPEERRRVVVGIAAQRRVVQLADEGLVRIGSLVEQELHEVERGQRVVEVGAQPRAVARPHVGGGIVHIHREIERPVVGIGAELEHRLRHVEPVVDDRNRHRGGVVAVGQLGIGPARDERAHRGFVPFARREHERGEAAGGEVGVLALGEAADVRLAVWIRTSRQQRLHHFGVALSGRPHQRGLLLIGVGGVGVRADLEQQLHRVERAGASRGHQRRFGADRRGLRVGAGANQRLNDRRGPGAARLKQRRDAVAIGDAHLGPGRDQRPRHVEVRVIGRPEQCRRTVGGLLVDVHALGDLRAHAGKVAVPGGDDQRAVACGLTADDEENSDERQQREQPP